MSLAFDAMLFARKMHAGQMRKYTNNPYADHLAEVAGIVATVAPDHPHFTQEMIAAAWLHDVMEDQDVPLSLLESAFGIVVARGVFMLSDLDEGNRAERKRLSRERLSGAQAWVQTVKVADLISNSSSIIMHDPKFAVTYLSEKRQLLNVMEKADERLVKIAREQCL